MFLILHFTYNIGEKAEYIYIDEKTVRYVLLEIPTRENI